MAVGEWDQRQLCPDGGCIGVIGPDGTCKTCGRAAPNWGDERNRGLNPPDDDDDDDADDDDLAADGEHGYDGDADDDDADDDLEDDDDVDDDDADDDLEDDEAAAASQRRVAGARGVWSGRELCPDGGCIGLIGPDGTCKVCGRAAADLPARGGDASATTAPASEGAASAPAAIAEASEGASASAATDASSDPPAAAAAIAPAAADRERCPDASCAGSIGADGRCETCGKGAS